MNPKKENPKITKVEEPSVVYETSRVKFKGIDWATFDFDEEEIEAAADDDMDDDEIGIETRFTGSMRYEDDT